MHMGFDFGPDGDLSTVLVLHPDETDNPEWIAHLQASRYEVYVMPKVDGALYRLAAWLEAKRLICGISADGPVAPAPPLSA